MCTHVLLLLHRIDCFPAMEWQPVVANILPRAVKRRLRRSSHESTIQIIIEFASTPRARLSEDLCTALCVCENACIHIVI